MSASKMPDNLITLRMFQEEVQRMQPVEVLPEADRGRAKRIRDAAALSSALANLPPNALGQVLVSLAMIATAKGVDLADAALAALCRIRLELAK